MLKAMKGNKVVRIEDEKKKYYMSLGFKIMDMKGKVLYDPVDNDEKVKGIKDQLVKKDVEIDNLKAQIEAKDEEIAALKAQIKELKAPKEDADKKNAKK